MKNGRYEKDRYIMYYKDGLLHREDGPAVEGKDGSKEWYLNGNLHREDGPAVEYADGSKEWYLHGNRHRLDGPAVEWKDGTKEWWINGEKLSKEEVLLAKKILDGKMWNKLPLYVNHPKLKYFAQRVLV